MTNNSHSTLYIGVTSNLFQRINEHKMHLIKNAFTDRYNLENCIYYEEYPTIELAIKREKELKKWRRDKKETLINSRNPEWKVLVTEKGFIRKAASFGSQVDDLINELQERGIIPSFGKNNQEE